MKIIKAMSTIYSFSRVLYLEQKSNVPRYFYSLKFENNLFSNELFSIVVLDKIWIKMCLIPLKQNFYILLLGESSSKSAFSKISYVDFCKLIQISKNVDTFREAVPPFDMKLK